MMKRQAFQAAVDAFRHSVPFKPFVIELEEGGPLVVDRPERFHCLDGVGTYFYPDGNFDFVDNENVVRVVELAETPANVGTPPSGA
jgi:hypothetical protein